MARRLLDAGFEVAVFDVVPENARELVELGAVEARSPEEAARGAEAVVVMVATPEQALAARYARGSAVWGTSSWTRR